MGKCTFVLLFMAVMVGWAFGQQATLSNLDVSGFPRMRARLLVRNAAGDPVSVQPSDLTLREGGILRPVTLVTCPPPKPTVPVSVALSIDCSGSMSNPNPAAIDLARTSATRLVESLALPPSDAAVQTCTDVATIGVDFTTKSDRIINAINKATAHGGNDFLEQLLNPSTGLLNIAKTGRNKRVAILFTDAYWGALPNADLQRCIDTCTLYDISFYAVVYSNTGTNAGGIVSSLKALADATTGLVMEGELTTQQASDLAATMAVLVQGAEPCTIEWMSSWMCTVPFTNKVELSVNGGRVATSAYTIVSGSVTSISCRPSVVQFKNVAVGSTASKTVRVFSGIEPTTILDVRATDARFTVTPRTFTIAAFDSADVTVTYTPTDGGYATTQLTFEASPCSITLYASVLGGGATPPRVRTLQLVAPNGGETFGVGADTVIQWRGVAPTDLVKLDYSTNAGQTWMNITPATSGLTYAWKRIPNTPSTTCLMRVEQLSQTSANADSSILWLPAVTAMHRSAGYAVGYENGYVIYHGSQLTGYYKSMRVHTDTVTAIAGSTVNVSGRIVTASSDRTIKSIDPMGPVPSRSDVVGTSATPTVVRAIVFGQNDSTVIAGGDDGVLREYRWPGMVYVRDVINLVSGITSMMTDRRASTVVIGMLSGDVAVYSLATNSLLWKKRMHTGNVRSVSWHPNDSLIATAGNDGEVYVIRPSGAATTIDVPSFGRPVSGVDWYNDTLYKYLAVAVEDDSLYVYSIPSMRAMSSKWLTNGPKYCAYLGSDGVTTSYGPQMSFCYFNGTTSAGSTSDEVGSISNCVWDGQGGQLAIGGPSGMSWIYDVTANRWKQLVEVEHEGTQMIALTTTGTSLIVSGMYSVRACDLITSDYAQSTMSFYAQERVKAHPQRPSMVGATSVQGVLLQDVYTKQIEPLVYAHMDPLDFAWSADGRIMAMLCPDGSITTYDCLANMDIKTFSAGYSVGLGTTAIDVSPDGTAVVVVSGEFVYVHDVNTGSPLAFAQVPGQMDRADYNADGSLIAVTGAYDNPVITYVFDAKTMRLIRSIGSPFPFKVRATSAQFSPMEDVLAISTDYASVLLYRIGEQAPMVQADTSDALWSIVRPQLTARNVDMLRVRVGTSRDSLVLALATLTSGPATTVDSMWITGPQASDFSVHSRSLPFTIDATHAADAEFRFSPSGTGIRRATCFIRVGTDTLSADLVGIGVQPSLSMTTTVIDLGAHIIGTVFDSTVSIARNTSPTSIALTSVCNSGPDSLQLSLAGTTCSTPPTLQPSDALTVSMRFAPRYIGRTSTIINIQTTDLVDPQTVLVLANGVGPTVSVRSDSGSPGDQRPITLLMHGLAVGTSGSGTTLHFNATLRYNASMLVTTTTPSRLVNGGIAEAEFQGTWSGTDSIVGALPATMVLGNADSTVVYLTAFTWIDDAGFPIDADVQLESGTYRLLSICKENGPRFFDPFARITSATIMQRGGSAGVEIIATHGGSIDCEFTTLEGKQVASYPVAYGNGTSHTEIDLSALPHGVYVGRLSGTNATALFLR